ncbi:CTP-dependent Riboflavin kinase [Halalkaliarchaeum sp. AArc-CO]|uniref:CTP-dependent riboflavin kinase n=1 Tax=Halalkaliarchaeum sp. AArc-CO TaxID=2866381 RepID=UPI00217EF931|nr:CTP-dependent riboflavin kinase [Halalkaliarchaeum sp. AArc-CO]UWG49454.1 CTP-dependent Riboflavin kinase [Halalkaliarchaeum sp. AArc-CO]
MSGTVPAVGQDELATLKLVALDGGLVGPVKVSCSELADRLDASNQTASRRLQALEAADHIERDVVSDGQWITVTDDGESALRREYADYRRIFEGRRSLTLRGQVISGMGEGRHYISLPGYMEQFRERLGYEPFPGTLNVELDEESARSRAGLRSIDGVAIDGWEDEERTFGPATCYPASVRRSNEGRTDGARSVDLAHVIVPERTHHDEENLELIAPDKLRTELDLEDGNRVTVEIHGGVFAVDDRSEEVA